MKKRLVFDRDLGDELTRRIKARIDYDKLMFGECYVETTTSKDGLIENIKFIPQKGGKK